MPFSLTSAAFAPGSFIPAQYSCTGADVSPPLAWNGVPPGTKTFTLIMDDPDAPCGTWVHWVLYDIPAAQQALQEGIPATGQLADGSRQGQNSWRRLGYGGPCPPAGTHRYYFRLFALDRALQLPAGATKEQALLAMAGHVLDQCELMGRFAR